MAENTAYTHTQYAEGDTALITGKIVYPVTAITTTDYTEIDVGFKPRYVRVENYTDRIGVEYWQGISDDNSLKTAADGTKTLETSNGGITLTDRTFKITQNGTLAVIAASKTLYYMAIK